MIGDQIVNGGRNIHTIDQINTRIWDYDAGLGQGAGIAGEMLSPSAVLRAAKVGVGIVGPKLADMAHDALSRNGLVLNAMPEGGFAAKGVHKNSLSYVGETHVYRIKSPEGSTYKIGESARGLNTEGASIRAEQQARRLTRETGDVYTTEIRNTLPGKASAREYETRVILRFRSLYGNDKLPGNLTNR